ncbi:unnamed protein product [Rotaria sp. Silwood2]|nr:unnamed protein product [Rotaria sp. Silwood2]
MSKFSSSRLKRLAVTSCRNTEWIMNFSELESLEYTINNCCWDPIILSWPSNLKHLKIVFGNDDVDDLVLQSLKHLSQLITLEIYQKELGKSFPNGCIWEQLIRSSLPLLKKLRFYFQFNYGFLSLNIIEKIMTSFSSSFFVNEKKWFIRCDIFSGCGIAIIYTLPFTFDRYTIFKYFPNKKILTLSNNNNINSNRNIYENIKTLIVESLSDPDIIGQSFTKIKENLNRKCILDLIDNNIFNSVERLHLLSNYYPYINQNYINTLSKNFGILLDKIPHLYSLDIQMNDLQSLTNNWTNLSVCNYLSEKIRSLKLSHQSRRQHFDGNELDQIVRIFSAKCQHLSICILSSIDTVISLLRDMQQLHSLNVFVQIKNDAEITIKWLEKQHIGLNYSNCFIVNHKQNYYFWLEK